MNSNRTKYASTPTFGMQKRGYTKKQPAAQNAVAPDFTKQAIPAANTLPPQNPFTVPQSGFTGAPTMQQGAFPPSFNAPLIPNAYPQPPMTGYPINYAQPTGGMMPPLTNAVQSAGGMMPPVANTASPLGAVNGYVPRQQGFVPPTLQQSTVIPASGFQRADTPLYQYPGTSPAPTGFAGAQQPGYPMMPQSVPTLPPQTRPMQPIYPAYGGGQAQPTPRQPFNMDALWKVILFGLIPLLFLPCVLVSTGMDWVRYLFMGCCVAGLSVMWYRQMFTSGTRTGVSVVYIALCVVTIALLLGGSRDVTQTSANAGAQRQPEAQVTADPAATAEPAPADVAPQETTAPPSAPGESEAEQRLTLFMSYWSVPNYDSMVSLVQPSWAATRENASAELFQLLANRVPQDFKLEDVSGSDGDSSRTVTMSATIDKNNGKDPVKYRFMILMVKEGEEWYVDPNSLATNDVVTEETEETGSNEAVAADGTVISQSLAPRMTVTPVPDPSTKLYYNADGGTYYHADPECSAVNKKYLPMASFLYSELGEAPYNKLQPCLKCGAPTEAAD